MAPRPSSALKVLVINDDKEQVDAFQRRLTETDTGFGPSLRIDHAMTGKEGLKRATKGRHDVILLDYHIPDEDPVAVLRAIRDQGLSVPVIALTSYPDSEETRQLILEGVDDCATKNDLFDAGFAQRVRTIAESARIMRELTRGS